LVPTEAQLERFEREERDRAKLTPLSTGISGEGSYSF
jgi:hypothetical protein